MKFSKPLAILSALSAAAFLAVAADSPAPAAPVAAPAAYSVTLSDAHICCGKCVKAAAAAVVDLKGVTAVADQDKKTILVSAPDKASAQKAMNLLTANGFYGKSSSADIKVDGTTGATAAKVSSLEVDDLHLCCGSCVKAVNDILAKVPGVKTNDAATGAKSFTITGDFSPKDVFDAFQKNGLTGKEGATKPEVKS